MASEEIIFKSGSGQHLTLPEMVSCAVEFMKQEPGRPYKVVIGTDSHPANPVSLVTAVVVWRVGNGAIHFWTESEARNFHTLRDRIWQEAIRSITLSQEVRSLLHAYLGQDFLWDDNEIHVDIGENGPTRELIDSVIGMIKGYNLVPVIKPYAFGASTVADRHT